MTTALGDDRTQIVITTGGTGITSRDGTFEAVDRLFHKRLDGFGELFRMLSFEEIGIGGDDEPRDRRNGRPQGDLRAARDPRTPCAWR